MAFFCCNLVFEEEGRGEGSVTNQAIKHTNSLGVGDHSVPERVSYGMTIFSRMSVDQKCLNALVVSGVKSNTAGIHRLAGGILLAAQLRNGGIMCGYLLLQAGNFLLERFHLERNLVAALCCLDERLPQLGQIGLVLGQLLLGSLQLASTLTGGLEVGWTLSDGSKPETSIIMT